MPKRKLPPFLERVAHATRTNLKARRSARKLTTMTPVLPQIVITSPEGYKISTTHWLSTPHGASFSMSRRSFLDLPPELRNKIYTLVSDDFAHGRQHITLGVTQGHLHPPPKLAQTCWAVRRESLAMVYSGRVFIGERRQILTALRPLRAETLKLIKGVEVTGGRMMDRHLEGRNVLREVIKEAEKREAEEG